MGEMCRSAKVNKTVQLAKQTKTNLLKNPEGERKTLPLVSIKKTAEMSMDKTQNMTPEQINNGTIP